MGTFFKSSAPALKKLMAVSIGAGSPLTVGSPRELFQTRITGARFVDFQYDVAPDACRPDVSAFLDDMLARRLVTAHG